MSRGCDLNKKLQNISDNIFTGEENLNRKFIKDKGGGVSLPQSVTQIVIKSKYAKEDDEVEVPQSAPATFFHFYRSTMYNLRDKKYKTDVLGKMEYERAVQQKLEGQPCTSFTSVFARILFQCIFSWIAILGQLGFGSIGLASHFKKQDVAFTSPRRRSLAEGESLGVASFWELERSRQVRLTLQALNPLVLATVMTILG